MSWGGLPFWVYESMREEDFAMMSCAFSDEWRSGTSKVLPKHVIAIDKATFSSHKYGAWNYEYSKEEIEELRTKNEIFDPT